MSFFGEFLQAILFKGKGNKIVREQGINKT